MSGSHPPEAAAADGVAKIVLESVQELLLKLALQMTRDDYETRGERQRQGSNSPRPQANTQAGYPTSSTINVSLRCAVPVKPSSELPS